MRSLSGVLSGNPSGHERDNFDQFLARLPNGSASLESATAIEVITRGSGNPSGTEHDNFDRFLARLPNSSAALLPAPTIEVITPEGGEP